MCPERTLSIRLLSATLAAALATLLAVAPSAHAAILPIPTPCDLPGGDLICDVIATTVKQAAQATADFIMRGVTVWVTDAAVWVTGEVGSLINATASPDVRAGWFEGQYASMITVAGALALPMLLLALIQAIWRQDVWILLRSAFGYLPMAFILAGAAIVATQLVISITDALSAMVVGGLGQASGNLLQSVGDAYKQALSDSSGNAVPLFGIFLGAIVLAIGAFVLWLEMVIRDAAIYIALFFLPLTFVAMIWPATSRWARRLVELLIAVILAKFVIVSILALATAAITNTTLADTGGGSVFERMMAGSALLVLAAWSPFALLRLIPMMEVAAASVTSQRAAMAGAAGSAGIQTPSAYMRQAMDRHSRASSSPTSATTGGVTYVGLRQEGVAAADEPSSGRTAATRAEDTSAASGGAAYRGSEPRQEEGRPATGDSRTQPAPPPSPEQRPQPAQSYEPPRRPPPPPERPPRPPRDES